MSTEFDLQVMTVQTLRAEPAIDPVMKTADDRPSPSQDSLPALVDPTADHLDDAVARRRADIEEKHQRIIRFLDENGLEAVVLTRADSVAWFTSGGDLRNGLYDDRASIQIYVNHQCRAVVCDNVQTARAFEEELSGLGFQLKEHPWHVGPLPLLSTLTRNRRIVSDGGYPVLNLPDESEALDRLRFPLTVLERQRLRELGRTLALTLEATARNFEPGETEADIAGHLAHRLMREGVCPVDLHVAGDDRLARYRLPSFKAAEIHRRATINAVGRRYGLCAGATRTVSFGPVDPAFRKAHELACMIDATCIFFSRPGESAGGVFRRARRIYEKFNYPDEWTLAYQGGVIGYKPREFLFVPESPRILTHGQPVCWSPGVNAARSEDTVVVDNRGYEVVTEAQRWPKLEVMVKGYPILRPAVLER